MPVFVRPTGLHKPVIKAATTALPMLCAAPLLLAAPQAKAETAPATPQATAQTKLTLRAEGRVQTTPDELTATFRIEARDKNPASAQQAVNNRVGTAMTQASKVEGVSPAALDYTVSEQHQEKSNTSLWLAQQTVTLKAHDSKALLPLVGQLQAQGLILEQLEWSVSEERRAALSLQAETEAVKDLQKQAQTLAEALGQRVAHFERVEVSAQSLPHPMPVMLMAARMSSGDGAEAPVASSTGEAQTIRASASATVLLAP